MSCPRPTRRPGPWMLALVRLHGLRLTDHEIADALSDLSDDAIADLEADGRWSRTALADATRPGAGSPPPWSARQVRYYRQPGRLAAAGLPTWPRTAQRLQALAELRRVRAVRHAVRGGWGHLSGRAIELTALLERGTSPADAARKLHWPTAAVLAWQRRPWDLLARAEVDLLSALAENGEQARASLPPTRLYHGRSRLAHLRDKALVCSRRVGRLLLYRLADGVRRWQEGINSVTGSFTPSGVDRLLASLGL